MALQFWQIHVGFFYFPTLELFVKLWGLVYEALQPVPANLICVKINK